jgi:hypothetical protein
MFVIVDLQTVFYTCCLGTFMICVGYTLLMPSPIFDVASQFDHCLEGSNALGTLFIEICHNSLLANIVVRSGVPRGVEVQPLEIPNF